jgi:membrane associated rhomboid family serine protease
MRAPNFGGRASSFVQSLLVLLIASFVLQAIVEAVGDIDANETFFSWTAFTPDGFLSGKLWTLVSYACLHDGPWHLVLNLLAIFFMGRALEDDLGPKMMTWLTLAGAASGALLWFIFNIAGGGLVGASAIAMAFVTTFCLRRPEQPITLLLFFVIPCTLKPKWILWSLLGIETYGFLFSELNGSSGVAHSAHLGGMLAGLFFFGYVRPGGISSGKRPHLQKPSWLKISKQLGKPGAPAGYSVNLDDREMVEQEVDRILDKINEKGFGSLTEDEKRTLDKAKSLLGK